MHISEVENNYLDNLAVSHTIANVATYIQTSSTLTLPSSAFNQRSGSSTASAMQLTDGCVLRELRISEEYHHRRCREYFFGSGVLTIYPTLPIPKVELEHIQDSCNKSTAIYSITSPWIPHTPLLSRDKAIHSDLCFSFYEQWFRDHNVDIDFGTFIAKLIHIEVADNEQRPNVSDVIGIHKAWCDHVEATLPLCSVEKDIGDPSRECHSGIGIDRKQNIYYRLRPLFRALILIVDHHASPGAEKVVHLVRTNIPSASEISSPITFYSISPKLESDMFTVHDVDNIITTTLSSAIDFVTALEKREKTAFPERQRDPSIIDERGTESGYFTKRAQQLGYTGPDIRKTSSKWVKLSDDEPVLPPFTPLVMQEIGRPGMKDDPIFARYRKSDERKKYRMGYVP